MNVENKNKKKMKKRNHPFKLYYDVKTGRFYILIKQNGEYIKRYVDPKNIPVKQKSFA